MIDNEEYEYGKGGGYYFSSYYFLKGDGFGDSYGGCPNGDGCGGDGVSDDGYTGGNCESCRFN